MIKQLFLHNEVKLIGFNFKIEKKNILLKLITKDLLIKNFQQLFG